MTHALICGISGQDGAYLAKLLRDKGYQVTGTSRDAGTNPFNGLKLLGVHERVRLVSMTLTDFCSVLQILERTRPDERRPLAWKSLSPASHTEFRTPPWQ